MSSLEDAVSLIEQLKQKYGVEESLSLYGPSVVVPNNDLKREWSQCLQQAGYHMYVGEHDGRVAWVIPLKAKNSYRRCYNRSYSNEAEPSTPILRASQDQAPGTGCITGRPWTSQEDQQILTMLNQGKSTREIARELAPKLDRSEEATKTRLLRLKHRQGAASKPTPAEEKPAETPTEKRVPAGSEPAEPELSSLLHSALLLAVDPKHQAALRLVLEACVRLATPSPEK